MPDVAATHRDGRQCQQVMFIQLQVHRTFFNAIDLGDRDINLLFAKKAPFLQQQVSDGSLCRVDEKLIHRSRIETSRFFAIT